MYQTTSAQAYASILDSLPNREMQVYQMLLEKGALTNKELAQELGWEINMVTGRTNNLVKKGYVKDSGRRPTKYGRTAIAWEVCK